MTFYTPTVDYNNTATNYTSILNNYWHQPMTDQTMTQINSTIGDYYRGTSGYYGSSYYGNACCNDTSDYTTDVVFNNSVKYTTAYDNNWNCKQTIKTWGSVTGGWYDDNITAIPYNGIYGGAYDTFDVKDMERRRKQEKLKHNLVIMVKSRAENIALQNAPQNELLAIETLREMISEEAFKKYITHGFILVKGSDGCMYQIFRNKAHTRVWRGGKVIEEICVRIRSEMGAPATDNVIAFKTMVEANVEEFKKLGNVYKLNGNSIVRVAA
jgi:hypothetical protein